MRDSKVRHIKKFTVLDNWVNCLGAMQTMDIYDYRDYYKHRSKEMVAMIKERNNIT